MKTPVLSVITVCFQARESLSQTIECILRQTWLQMEYLVIDGGSDDGTREMLEQSAPRFAERRIPFHFLSEPDGGIYDAMNKGARMAEGRWLLFLNAGDLLADDHTLEQLFAKSSDAQILYGDTLCVYQGQQKLYPALPIEHLTYEMAFCHQSALIRRELMLEHPYDTSYRICADHHFFLSMYLQGQAFEYRPMTISVYEIAGYSDQHKMTAHREQHRMFRELKISRLSPAGLCREILFYLKQGAKTLFGQKLIDSVRKKRLH